MSEHCKDFLKSLLNNDPKQRLGHTDGQKGLLEHAWLEGEDIQKMQKKLITPPFTPDFQSDNLTKNFANSSEAEEAFNTMLPGAEGLNMKRLRAGCPEDMASGVL